MPTLKLPDGSIREAPAGARPRDVAEAIGKRLAKDAVAAKVDGAVVDLDRELPAGAGEVSFAVLTPKDPEALEVLRHSTAHIMARAVMRLFPGTQLAFGPPLENGFYYDIDSPTPITEADFPRIEEEMRKIVADAEPFERFERPTAEARELVRDLGQQYKVEHIDEDLAKANDTLSFYRQGEFIDLCRGPHIPHAGKVGAFKVLSIAGAYWKNDQSRKQLQRLYATAFFNQKDLDAYLHQLEEAKKRDHRLLGKQLKLFTISQAVGSGLILWMPKGATVRGILESFIKEELLKRGYQPVYTPHIGRLELYRTSGHFPYYRDAQYPPLFLHPLGQTVDTWLTLLEKDQLTPDLEKSFLNVLEEAGKGMVDVPGEPSATVRLYKAAQNDKAKKLDALKGWVNRQEGYLLKPMNCPHHIQIYKAEPRSYRDLPVRLAEFGTVYRFEQTGELSGMTRVRGFTQDDAHLFVTPEQIEQEFSANLDLVLFVLSSLGLSDYRVRVGLRDRRQLQVRRSGGGLGQGGEYIALAGEGARHELHRRAGRGGVLRAEDRLRGARLHRPRMAAGHRAARLQPAKAVRAGVRRRRQPHASAGDDPPGAVRLDGALHGHPDRALRRRLPALAGAGAGAGGPDQRALRRLRQEGRGGDAVARLPRQRRLPAGEDRLQDPRSADREDSVHAGGRREGAVVRHGRSTRSRGRRPWGAAAGGGGEADDGGGAREAHSAGGGESGVDGVS